MTIDEYDRLRQEIALNIMRYQLDDQGNWPMDKVIGCLNAVTEEHSGDCTNQCWTCLRCCAEVVYKQADEMMKIIENYL